MYPLKFQPILKSTLWGGEKIIPFKHLDSNQTQVGESWEISDVPGDESIVANGADAGKNLTQMVNEYKGALVGEANYQLQTLQRQIPVAHQIHRCPAGFVHPGTPERRIGHETP